jgi:hypothetical protein
MKAVGQCPEFVASGVPEERDDVEAERELDSLARSAGGRDDDDPTGGTSADERGMVRRKVRILNPSEGSALVCDC